MTNRISARSIPSLSASKRTPEPPGQVPAGARNQVAYYLGVVTSLEEQLRDALVLVSERHERNYEIARGATVLAVWSAELLKKLEMMRDRYGDVPSEAGEMLRAALLGGTRIGVVGEMNDI